LQHRFIRGSRKTAHLTELIERYQDYRARSPPQSNGVPKAGDLPTIKATPGSLHGVGLNVDAGGSINSAWSFSTARSSASVFDPMGSVHDTRHVLNFDPREEDEDEYEEWDDEVYEQSLNELRAREVEDDQGISGYDDDYDTSRAVAGSLERPKLQLGMNRDAALSSTKIKVPPFVSVLNMSILNIISDS
jgi:serine/threonine-protein kinase 24/25/MST4